MRALFASFFVLASCAFLMPATWRAFHADPDDAAPAITRALDARGIEVEAWDQAKRTITTQWILSTVTVDQTRERYLIRWEKNEDDGTLVIYVRHEAQDRDLGPAQADWSVSYHDAKKETRLLDEITKALSH